MTDYKDLFMRYMDRQGIKYTDIRDFVVKVCYSGDNMPSIPIFVYFDKDGDPFVAFKCWEIMNFRNNPSKGVLCCNQANQACRWIRFYMDEDCDIISSCDACIDEQTCGKECLDVVRRMVSFIDQAYPIFAKIVDTF